MVLYKLEVKKNKRTGTGAEIKAFSGMKSGKNIISFNVATLGNGIYKIIPNQKLLPGEYFFGGKPVQSATTIDVFAFGVD